MNGCIDMCSVVDSMKMLTEFKNSVKSVRSILLQTVYIQNLIIIN